MQMEYRPGWVTSSITLLRLTALLHLPKTGSVYGALRREVDETSEAGVESLAIWAVSRAARNLQGRLVKVLEEVQHRAIIVLAEGARHMDDVVG